MSLTIGQARRQLAHRRAVARRDCLGLRGGVRPALRQRPGRSLRGPRRAAVVGCPPRPAQHLEIGDRQHGDRHRRRLRLPPGPEPHLRRHAHRCPGRGGALSGAWAPTCPHEGRSAAPSSPAIVRNGSARPWRCARVGAQSTSEAAAWFDVRADLARRPDDSTAWRNHHNCPISWPTAVAVRMTRARGRWIQSSCVLLTELRYDDSRDWSGREMLRQNSEL